MPVYSVFFALLTLAAIGLPTTSGFTGEFLVLLGAFNAAWPQYERGVAYPLRRQCESPLPASCWARSTCCRSHSGSCSAPSRRRISRCATSTFARRSILASLVVVVFALGLFPAEPMRKTELAAREFQQLVLTSRTGTRVADVRVTPGPQRAPATESASKPTIVPR